MSRCSHLAVTGAAAILALVTLIFVATHRYARDTSLPAPAPAQRAAPTVAKVPPAQTPKPVNTAALLAIVADSHSVISDANAARAANARIMVRKSPLEPARPFVFAPARTADRERAGLCLAQAIYYEAGFEGEAGRRAVAQVVLNRVRHPAFPHSVCGVVYQRISGVCQFSFACDGALAEAPLPGLWAVAKREAREALAGKVAPAVGMATHYHADYVYPAWAPRLDKIAEIGLHIFYRWPQGWGRRTVFTARYGGVEPRPPARPMLIQGRRGVLALPTEVAPYKPDDDAGYVDTSRNWRPSISDLQSEAPKASPAPGASP